ncbi:MAG: tRNA-dihydrouridine synthase family protein [Eubacteriales bacterium]|nr:tRNA-dihydrouridine synthase family protein [Eubacteriales bacterium]
MKYYAAPMEGITGYVYRNAHHHFYPGMDRYYTPFLTPKAKKGMTSKEKNDILPEHNRGITVVPQVLTNQSDHFLNISEALYGFGYDEVNLNLGCPSGTVVSKGKGCGFLADQEALDRFFDQVMEGLHIRGIPKMKVSVKTRLGVDDPGEMPSLMEIYNRYPLSEIIIHARIHKDFYKKPVNLEAFSQALSMSAHPVCYNGDLFSRESLDSFHRNFPEVDRVMLGRGMIANPQLQKECEGKIEHFEYDRFFRFHEELLQGYIEVMSGDRNVLFKMKELWSYMGAHFPQQEKIMKKIKKSNTLVEYKSAVQSLSF